MVRPTCARAHQRTLSPQFTANMESCTDGGLAARVLGKYPSGSGGMPPRPASVNELGAAERRAEQPGCSKRLASSSARGSCAMLPARLFSGDWICTLPGVLSADEASTTLVASAT